ncbi:MAG: outer membrane lipoprotein carrier protein LolA [Litoreibacter sp.]
MNIKNIIASALAVAATAGPAMADKIPLTSLSSYMNSLKTAIGDFTQINADGTVTTGEILIKRPGRIRFEYAPPDNSLVIAGGQQVAIFDPKSNVPPEQFPLKRTPLNLILAANVDLSRSNMVVGHTDDGTATVVTVQDPENPNYGNIQLKFTDKPVQLRQWVITNEAGEQTTVILGEMQNGVDIGSRPFSIVTEIQARGLN